MKKLLLTLFCATAAWMASATSHPMKFDQLPKQAQEFVNTYFANEPIQSVEMNSDHAHNLYLVHFTNGNQIAFDGKTGECVQLNMKQGVIPQSMLPNPLASYINEHYPSQQVVMMSRTSDGYKAGLSNGVCLKFDKDGKFLKKENWK